MKYGFTTTGSDLVTCWCKLCSHQPCSHGFTIIGSTWSAWNTENGIRRREPVWPKIEDVDYITIAGVGVIAEMLQGENYYRSPDVWEEFVGLFQRTKGQSDHYFIANDHVRAFLLLGALDYENAREYIKDAPLVYFESEVLE